MGFVAGMLMAAVAVVVVVSVPVAGVNGSVLLDNFSWEDCGE